MVEKELKLIDLPGIGAGSVEKLEKAGIMDVMTFASRGVSAIAEASGVGNAVARKAIQYIRDNVKGFKPISLSEYRALKKQEFCISTSSKALDDLLHGGIHSGSINEAYAQNGVSKSQLGLTLTVNNCMKGNKTYYLDSEGGFRLDRIEEIIDAKIEKYTKEYEEGFMEEEEGYIGRERQEDGTTKEIEKTRIKKTPFTDIYPTLEEYLKEKYEITVIDKEKILDNVLFQSVDNSGMQMMVIDDIGKACSEDDKITLLVIDSLTEHFRAEFLGRGELNTRQLQINKHLSDIKKLCKTYNIAVYITNQVMADPGCMFGDPIKPIGGEIYGHKMDYRLYLIRAKENTRVAKLKKARNFEEGEAPFKVTAAGIEDI